ncbi:universal stress protein [Sphingobacterium sp. HJSM2_6]|uniref:universal stress protein n=1 Tax=Sphingobacterium sp. HJSM2_6 TaxID=3366264 RepID=UPI003BE392FA
MTILVPTDFSENARYAALYAAELATSKNYNVHLIHGYTSSSVLDENNDVFRTNSLKADEKIQEWKTLLTQAFPALTVTIQCTRSLITEKLSELSRNNEFELIIMGASGASTSQPIYWGSTTMAVASQADIPVLVIPNTQTALSTHHVALLTNFKPEELDTLKACTQSIGNPQLLTLIHVFKDSQQKQAVLETVENWIFNIREMMPTEKIDYILEPIHKDDETLDTVPEVVSNIIRKLNPDMILVTPSRKSFFERLFKTSVSKAIALELEKPTFFDKI